MDSRAHAFCGGSDERHAAGRCRPDCQLAASPPAPTCDVERAPHPLHVGHWGAWPDAGGGVALAQLAVCGAEHQDQPDAVAGGRIQHKVQGLTGAGAGVRSVVCV